MMITNEDYLYEECSMKMLFLRRFISSTDDLPDRLVQGSFHFLRIVKAVNECKTQATIAKKFVGQIEKKKWPLKKRSSSKGELEKKYDFDEDDISWGSDFDEDDLDEDDVANGEFDENRFNHAHTSARLDDCRAGHYDQSQLNQKLVSGEQLLNVGRFERTGTPPNGTVSNHYALNHHHHSNLATNGLMNVNNLDNNIKNIEVHLADGNHSDGCTASISSSGVSSVCGTNNDVSPASSSYASACCSSGCNSSAADSTCSQSPPPLSTSSSTSSSAKLACKLLAKLLTNSNGQLDNEHLSAKNLQLKIQLNKQLNRQFSKINEQSQVSQTNNIGHKLKQINQDDYLLNTKSSSMSSVINHNNNYIKNVQLFKPFDLKANLLNKSMINLNQYNQLNDHQFKVNESNLNCDEIIAVKTNNNPLGSPKCRLNNSTSNLSTTFKSIATKSDNSLVCSTVNRMNKNSIVARQIEHLEQLNHETQTNHSFKSQDNEDDLSSGSSSILSTFKYNGSDKSYVTAKDSSGSCSSSIRSVSLKQLNKPVVPPKPNINAMKEERTQKKPKIILRPSIEPPLPPLNNMVMTIKKDNKATVLSDTKSEETMSNTKDQTNKTNPTVDTKSPYSSLQSLNDQIISEFTIEEVNEILNCKLLSDEEDNELLNDTDYTRKLLQQQFSAKSLHHLNEQSKTEQAIENNLQSKLNEATMTGNQTDLMKRNQVELNERLMLTKNDLINNLNSLDKDCKISESSTIDGFKSSRFDYKFTNQIDSILDAECLNEKTIFNLRKTGNQRTKLGFNSKDNLKQIVEDEFDDYEKPMISKSNETKNIEINSYPNSEKIELIDQAISPPPEFRSYDCSSTTELNKTIEEQLQRQNNLNKHLQSRSSVDLVQQSLNRLNGHQVTPLPPPASFSSSVIDSSSSKSLSNHSSMLAQPNRPKLPTASKNKLDFLNTNSKLTSAKIKLPNKLKQSLPDIFNSKMSSSSQNQKIVSTTNKLIDDQSNNNNFSSTSLVKQTTSQQVNHLAVRPLPALPLEHYAWYHNLEREVATSLLIKFNKEGGYLVRTSKRAGYNSPYSLTIYHDEKCFNLNIRRRVDGMYALGKEKDKEKIFETIPQLIEFHQMEPILLTTKGQNAGSTKLTATPSKH